MNNSKLYVSTYVTSSLHEDVSRDLALISAEDQTLFIENYLIAKKYTQTAYLLLLFGLGTQFIYLKRWDLQILYWLTLGGLFLWTLFLLIRMPVIIDLYNHTLAREILNVILSNRND